MNETANVLVSVAPGFALIVAFAAVICCIGRTAFAVAQVRGWLAGRRERQDVAAASAASRIASCRSRN
ncbi:MAG: hypothetical protein ABIP29_03965 [Candidatus Eisenbacteria bacterium]